MESRRCFLFSVAHLTCCRKLHVNWPFKQNKRRTHLCLQQTAWRGGRSNKFIYTYSHLYTNNLVFAAQRSICLQDSGSSPRSRSFWQRRHQRLLSEGALVSTLHVSACFPQCVKSIFMKLSAQVIVAEKHLIWHTAVYLHLHCFITSFVAHCRF